MKIAYLAEHLEVDTEEVADEYKLPAGRHPCYGGPTRFATEVEAWETNVAWADWECEQAYASVDACAVELTGAKKHADDMSRRRELAAASLDAAKKRVQSKLPHEKEEKKP